MASYVSNLRRTSGIGSSITFTISWAGGTSGSYSIRTNNGTTTKATGGNSATVSVTFDSGDSWNPSGTNPAVSFATFNNVSGFQEQFCEIFLIPMPYYLTPTQISKYVYQFDARYTDVANFQGVTNVLYDFIQINVAPFGDPYLTPDQMDQAINDPSSTPYAIWHPYIANSKYYFVTVAPTDARWQFGDGQWQTGVGPIDHEFPHRNASGFNAGYPGIVTVSYAYNFTRNVWNPLSGYGFFEGFQSFECGIPPTYYWLHSADATVQNTQLIELQKHDNTASDTVFGDAESYTIINPVSVLGYDGLDVGYLAAWDITGTEVLSLNFADHPELTIGNNLAEVMWDNDGTHVWVPFGVDHGNNFAAGNNVGYGTINTPLADILDWSTDPLRNGNDAGLFAWDIDRSDGSVYLFWQSFPAPDFNEVVFIDRIDPTTKTISGTMMLDANNDDFAGRSDGFYGAQRFGFSAVGGKIIFVRNYQGKDRNVYEIDFASQTVTFLFTLWADDLAARQDDMVTGLKFLGASQGFSTGNADTPKMGAKSAPVGVRADSQSAISFP